mgnify:FL=1
MFKIFGGTNRSNPENGKDLKLELIDMDQWSQLLTESENRPVFIFKHSIRCGTSSMVLRRFEKKMSEWEQPYYFLNILSHRSLSNIIAETLNVRHESPQLIVLKHGKAFKHESHFGILDILQSVPH